MRYPPYNVKTTSLMRTLTVNRWVEAEAGQCSDLCVQGAARPRLAGQERPRVWRGTGGRPPHPGLMTSQETEITDGVASCELSLYLYSSHGNTRASKVLEVCGPRQDGGGGEAVAGRRGRGLLVRQRHHHAQQLLAPPRRQRHGPGHGSMSTQARGPVEPYLDITVAQAFLCGLITDI